MMTERNGRCLCQAVSYRLTADPIAVRVCWCRDCQRLAANGSVNALVPAAALEISGEVTDYTMTADSGNRTTRQFCARCGSHLFARSSARPQFAVVRVGTLDEPSSVRPAMNIWSVSAPGWACLDAELERVEKQPSPPSGAGAAAPIPKEG
jgi:hypothetical protein